MTKLSPSILSADFANLLADIKKVEEAGVEYLHIDIMDGHFVPNISFGPIVMNAIKDKINTPLDVHLMIENPDQYIPEFAKAGADIITVHQEASTHLHRTVQLIKEHGCKAGVSLNPATPINTIEEILPYIDMVLIMSVNPGFGGQSYIASMTDKISRLKKIISENNYNCLIEVDGGVKVNNCREIADAGVDILVAGSAIFGADDVQARVAEFREVLK